MPGTLRALSAAAGALWVLSEGTLRALRRSGCSPDTLRAMLAVRVRSAAPAPAPAAAAAAAAASAASAAASGWLAGWRNSVSADGPPATVGGVGGMRRQPSKFGRFQLELGQICYTSLHVVRSGALCKLLEASNKVS